MNSWSSYAYAGTRQKGYYAQLSGTMLDQDHWNLSNDFTPISLANENGGERSHANTQDWRINTKVGLTPDATDEYSINFTVQQGEKSAPLHIAGQRVQGPRYWDWPYWDTSSVSWLSKTQIGSESYFKSNVYYNTFKNLLGSYTDASFTIQNRNSQDFNSYYEDYAGSYALVNLKAEYAFTEGTTLNVGAANLLDEDYALAEGFPEPGRTFFANIRARY